MKTLAFCAVALALRLSAFAQPEAQSPLGPKRFAWTIDKHAAAFQIVDPPTKGISGVLRTAVRRPEGTTDTTYQFHLRGPVVDSVFVNGRRADVASLGSETDFTFRHHVVLGSRSPSIVIDTVVIHYSGTMTTEGGASSWGGVSYDDGVLYALGVGFSTPTVSATQHWLPVMDHPGYKAPIDLDITVPRDFVAASVGRLDGVDTLGGSRIRYRWRHSYPCATYLLTFAVAPFHVLDLGNDVVPHVAYVQAADTTFARMSLRLVPRMRQVFESAFGPYPFEKVGYMSTTKGAMEHQTMIAINTAILRQRDSVNLVAAHELAHQWFGDLVSPADFRYAWLTESFATWSESFWLENLYNRDAYFTSQVFKNGQYIGTISRNEGIFALEDFPRQEPSSNYPETIYQKGAVVLGMLRYRLGDSAYFRGLRSYLSANAGGNATTDTFFDAMEEASGQQLDAFVTEWIRSKGWPMISIDIAGSGDERTVVLRQIQQRTHPDWPIFTTLPLNVVWQDRSGRQVDTVVTFDASGACVLPTSELPSLNVGSQVRSLVQQMGVTTVSDRHDLTVHVTPTPASESVTVRFFGKGALPTAVRLHTIDGRLVRTVEAETQSATISVADCVAGNYVVTIMVNDETISTVPILVVR